jgi:sodium/proline symporter
VLLDVPERFDAELALPLLSQGLLPAALVGLILAGLFAATISTADTQILCCSAAITQDLAPRLGRTYAGAKAGTLGVTAVVLLIALFGSRSVFELVVMSWSALASALGPLLAVQALGLPINSWTASSMILVGLASALGWRYGLGYSGSVYEVLPGMAAGFLVYGAARLWPARGDRTP